MPPIDVILIEDPEPLGPFGAKGIGEPALIATADASAPNVNLPLVNSSNASRLPFPAFLFPK